MHTLFFLISFGLLLQSSCSFLGIQNEESPTYDVVFKEDNKEIRLYKSYLAASTSVSGEYKMAQSKAFKKLAGYIFGKNKAKQKLAMTSPVTQEQDSQKIAMTSPVTQEKKGDAWTMRFMMPSTFTLENLPEPTENGITFEIMPERYVAAITYTWLASEKRNQAKAEELAAWLQTQEQFALSGTAQFAGYNPPWTIPFLRRNEMLIEVKQSN